MWRPDDWKNPYLKPQPDRKAYTHIYYDIYEAGADAILKALTEKAHYASREKGNINYYSHIYDSGWMVFIPEIKEK